MSMVEQIEAQIEQLDAKTFDELRGWFIDHLHDRWDRQIEADSAAGKLDFLIDESAFNTALSPLPPPTAIRGSGSELTRPMRASLLDKVTSL